MKRLPDKMSDLLKLGLKDEAKANRSPRYDVDMDIYHEIVALEDDFGDYRDTCQVCFAGGVMAFTLNGKWGESLSPEDFYNGNVQKLHALDMLRRGKVYAAACYMKLVGVFRTANEFSYHEFSENGVVHVSNYIWGRLAWRRSMFHLADRLARAGL